MSLHEQKSKEKWHSFHAHPFKKTLLFRHALLENTRSKYRNAKGERKSQTISKVITGHVLRKYRMQRLAQVALGFSKAMWQIGTNSYTYQRKPSRRVGNYLVDSVRAFYQRDDVSRMTTGKKQTVTLKKKKKSKNLSFWIRWKTGT